MDTSDTPTKEVTHSIDISEFTSNLKIISFMKKKFKRMSREGAMNLIGLIINGQSKIPIKSIQSKFIALKQYNLKKFDDNNFLLEEEIESLRTSLNGLLAELGKDVVFYDKEQHKDIKVETIDGEDVFVLTNNISYEKVRKITCDEAGNVQFKYDFNNPDILNQEPPKSINTLQRVSIQITSQGQKFGYATEYTYKCYKCGNKVTKKAYEMIGTKTKYMCEGVYRYMSAEGESKSKICNTQLYPDNDVSSTRDAFFYSIAYEDEKETKQSVTAISFIRYDPGFYDAVLYKIHNPNGLDTFQIIDIKEIEKNTITLPEKQSNKNYVFTLMEAMDDFIEKQTGLKIYGLFPIKCALIMQRVFDFMNTKIANIQIVGDASTGKSTILKYYGFCLNNHLHYSTNGQSLSIPSLRGTRESLTLLGKEHKIITLGYLGTFKTLHIDEAADNQELIQNMKTFLLEDNYAYDKAGSNGTFHKRTIMANVSQNISENHIGQYIGMIKKAYKQSDYLIPNVDKQEWDDSWNLMQSLEAYVANPYLLKVISDTRKALLNKRTFWIDGYEIALHERFPFYFFLVSEVDAETLKGIVKKNAARNTISENVELMRALKTDNINEFMSSLKEYILSDTDEQSFDKLDKIMDAYNLVNDSRTNKFYYTLLRASRILNKRKDCIEEDFNLVKWFIEKMHRKLDITETVDYEIKGPTNIKQITEQLKNINQASNTLNDSFGISEDLFE